jgi:hypothetical protein
MATMRRKTLVVCAPCHCWPAATPTTPGFLRLFSWRPRIIFGSVTAAYQELRRDLMQESYP